MVSNNSQKKIKNSKSAPLKQRSGVAAAVASAPVILSPSSTASTESLLLDPSPLPSDLVLRAILKGVPQCWIPLSLKEDPLSLRPRLEAIFGIIQRCDDSGGEVSVVLSYLEELLDEDSQWGYTMRFECVDQSWNGDVLNSNKVINALLKVFHYKDREAYVQIMNPTVKEREDIKTALQRLHSLIFVYDVSDPATAVARLLELLLSKPEFSGLSNFRGSDDYAGLLKAAIDLCNYCSNNGNALPSFSGVSNNNSTEAGQLSLLRKRKGYETSKGSKRISNLYKAKDVDNVISERKLKSLIKDGVALDEAIVLARISSTSGRSLDSTSPGDFQPTDSNVPLSDLELKILRVEQQEQQQLTLLCNLLPSNWLLIDHRMNDVVLKHQLKVVFQTIQTILPPNAPITTRIAMLRKVSSDEFSILLRCCLRKVLPSLNGPEFPSTSEVIKAIMKMASRSENYLLLMYLEYPRPRERESTVRFLKRLMREAEKLDWKVPSASSRNLICYLANNSNQFSPFLFLEDLYPDYKALLNKAIKIAQRCEDGEYPIKLGTDIK